MEVSSNDKQNRPCVLLTLCLAAAVIPFSTAAVFAASGGESVYVMQEGSGNGTLASAVMLVRQAAIESGASSDQWKQITQTSLKQAAWVEGVGLRHSFLTAASAVSYKNLTVEDKSAELIRLLSQHPEGIEIYLRSVPHAVLLTRYDSKTDTLHCGSGCFHHMRTTGSIHIVTIRIWTKNKWSGWKRIWPQQI